MGDGNETGEHESGSRGQRKRWHDSAKVVWALIGGISFIIASWGGIVYAKASSSEIKNAEQDVKIEYIIKDQNTTQQKLDWIMNRLK